MISLNKEAQLGPGFKPPHTYTASVRLAHWLPLMVPWAAETPMVSICSSMSCARLAYLFFTVLIMPEAWPLNRPPSDLMVSLSLAALLAISLG